MASTAGSDRCSSLFDLVKNDISASKKEGIARHLKLLEDREASEGNVSVKSSSDLNVRKPLSDVNDHLNEEQARIFAKLGVPIGGKVEGEGSRAEKLRRLEYLKDPERAKIRSAKHRKALEDLIASQGKNFWVKRGLEEPEKISVDDLIEKELPFVREKHRKMKEQMELFPFDERCTLKGDAYVLVCPSEEDMAIARILMKRPV